MFEQVFKNLDDVLWKEAGCGSELDYTEQSSWILFLKYLDDLEDERQTQAELDGKPYRRIIDDAHRWSKWAAPKTAYGGVRSRERADRAGPDRIRQYRSFFPTCRASSTSAERPDTIEYKIGEIFCEIGNKFRSGYSLRDALELVDQLRFQLAEREARAFPSVRSQDQEHGQCRAQRRRVLHAAPAHPRDDQGGEAADRRAHL